MRHESLGRIKIGLAGTDTSSLLEIIEGHFGHVDLDTFKSTISTEKSEKEVTKEENLLIFQKKPQPHFAILVA